MRLLLVLILLPAGAAAQSVPITFRVHMSYQVAQEAFDPAGESVDVAGTFNGWGSTHTPLADTNGDLTYEVTVGGFQPGATIEYKFRLNGVWDGREEFPGVGNNRVYQVQSADNVITVWYNDEAPPTGPPAAAFDGTRVLSEGGVAYFRDLSAGEVTARQWAFPGGTPETSSDGNPAIRYLAPGFYDVSLIASGPEGVDTLTVANYVEVRERPAGEAHWWNDTVFYEVFVRSFYDSSGDGIGDFDGLTAKLDYLNDGDPTTDTDLGITGIWLMPVHDSPSSHGYDVTNYRSINPDYGTMESFQTFLAAAHERGIRVIIDYVVNHSSSQHPWFQASGANHPEYREFYRWSATHPGYNGPLGPAWHSHASGFYYGVFWSGMPDLNFETTAVKDSMFAAADFWLNEIGVDGFRLDAVKYIFEDGTILEDAPQTFAFWSDFSAAVRDSNPEAVTVCEAWSGTESILPYVMDGNLDFCFEFDLAGRMLQSVRTGNAIPLATKMQEVYGSYPHLQVGTFLTNHDMDRVMEVLEGDVDRYRAAAALYLTLPGVPFIYYGEEIGMLGAKPDPDIRRPMQWTAGPNGGFTNGNPWRALNSNYADWNVEAQLGDPESLLHWYRNLISARTASGALRRGDYFSVPSSSQSLMAFLRVYEDEVVLVTVNTSDSPQSAVTLSLPPGVVSQGDHLLVNLIDEESASSATVSSGAQIHDFAIGGHGAAVYRFASGVSSEDDPDEAPALGLDAPYPNPARGTAHVGYRTSARGPTTLELFDMLGRKVRTIADGDAAAGHHSIIVDTGTLSAGIYLLRLSHGGHMATRRLVVLR